MAIEQARLVSYLDDFLRVAEVEDYPNALNGLQVEGTGPVSRVVVAVDACEATIRRAAEQRAQFMVVHHGLFWGGLQPVTGRQARRLRLLLENGIGLYASHLPLDVHPEVGNNAVLARWLELDPSGWFGDYRGRPIGVLADADISRGELVDRVQRALGVEPKVIGCGPDRVRRIGIITGGAGDMIRDARDAGLDTFVTGEGAHHTYFDAEEWRLNVIYAGHYATETVGVKALGAHLERHFDLQWDFADHPTGL